MTIAPSRLSPASAGIRKLKLATTHTVFCFDGHHIRQDAMVLGHAGLRCKHKEPAPGKKGHLPECGAWVYVVLVPEMNAAVRVTHGDAAQAVLVLEASYAELVGWQREAVDPRGILEATGAFALLPSLSCRT